MKKKIIAICLCVALVAVGIVGATLAYFTDKDQVVNTFEVGNVKIDLYEYADFDGDGERDETPYQNHVWYSDIMPGDEMIKAPVIENKGANEAYVRVAIVMNNLEQINDAIDKVYENLETPKTDDEIQAIYDDVFDGWGLSYLKTAAEPRRLWMDESDHQPADDSGVELIGIDMWSRNAEIYGQFSETNLFKSTSELNSFGDGVVYIAQGWDSYYQDAADVNDRVFVFYLKMAPGAKYELFQGLNVPTEFSSNVTVKYDGKDRTFDQMAMFEDMEIGIYADAIQTANFTTYTDAFTALEAANPLGWWN